MKKLLAVYLCLVFTAATAFAYDTVLVAGDGYSYLFNIYKKGEDTGMEDEGKTVVGAFDILSNYQLPLFKAGQAWASVITGATSEPVSYIIVAENDFNAAAYSPYTKVAELPYRVTMVNAAINDLTPVGDPDMELPTNGFIMLGLGTNPNYPGWKPYDGFHSLNRSLYPDLTSVMLHEVMHSLGVSSGAAKYNEEEGDETSYFSAAGDPLTIFDKDLRLYQGDTSLPFDPSLELEPEPEMAVGAEEDFDIATYSPYYVGENTIKVLGGDDDYDDARDAIVANGGFTNYSGYYSSNARPKVYGMPIHPIDNGEEGPELSHLELRNSFMSHQDYRNWLVPMEAELAVLKDVGYDIDLRRHFGKSYYLSNVTDTFTSGFSEWDGTAYTGTPSDVTQAVGVHIYGDNNTITQASDILTAGDGSFGVRIEGVNNTYTLKTGQDIQADGTDSIGLGVTWGSGHQITVETGASVTANGTDGVAVAFDFGDTLFGGYDTDKGSYSYYYDPLEVNIDPEAETRAALVSKFNVAGTLTGEQAAILIGNNAHVEDINLLDGAQINGDIISKWNSVKSGINAMVQYFNGETWNEVDPDDPSQIYFTRLNIAAGDTVNVTGDIDGSNDTYNTLKLHNAGTLNLGGETLALNLLENDGILNVQRVDLNTQSGEINGAGTINVAKSLELDSAVTTIENTLSLASDAVLSTLNDEAQSGIEIDTLKSYGGKLVFDLGDTFAIQNPDAADAAAIGQIKLLDDNIDVLSDTTYVLFDDGYEALDLGTSAAHVYYNGKTYTFTQSALDANVLDIDVADGGELGDAVADATAANYIAVDGMLTKDAGTVQGDSFEISGEAIDVNGHKGLVIDGVNNPSGTLLRTGISGAADSNLTVQNGGTLLVSAQDGPITLGAAGETALSLSGANVMFDSKGTSIDVLGSIQGTDKLTDSVEFKGHYTDLNEVSHVTLKVNSSGAVQLNAPTQDTVFEIKNGSLQVEQDGYLGASGDNEIVVEGGVIYLKNDQASDIALSKMTLKNDVSVAIDVDLKTLAADRFVFADSADLDTQSHLLYLARVNVLNPQAVLENESYAIPVASAAYHSENFLGGVATDMQPYTLQTPIFRYNVSFEQNDSYAGLLLARGSNADYKSYNPAVLVSPVAAQLGGYLGQMSVNEQAFVRMDTYLTDALQDPVAGKLLAAGKDFHGSLVEPSAAHVWASPYATFGKVPLKHGPEISSRIYGTAVGIDSQRRDFGHDWSGVGGIYAAYNGSHQSFKGNSMNQNGGWLGLSAIAYKNNFYTELLAGGGMSNVRAKTQDGREHWNMTTASVAAKGGYNWELGARGQWQLQPELLAAYTLVHTPDYTSTTGVRINADNLQTFTLQPLLRLTGDLQKWGKPYAELAWVGNLHNGAHVKANSVDLPQFAVKSFMKYGLGIRQTWAQRWGGFVQANFTSGGVRSVGAQAGISYALP